jgi:hypothetical protein
MPVIREAQRAGAFGHVAAVAVTTIVFELDRYRQAVAVLRARRGFSPAVPGLMDTVLHWI